MNYNRISGAERPFIIGIGGTFSPNSSTERGFECCRNPGAETAFFWRRLHRFPDLYDVSEEQY